MTMLETIAGELDISPQRSLVHTLHAIVRELVTQNRMLIVDEADYLVDKKALLNTLRDLHDNSTMPLILVGMADFVKKLKSRIDQRQFAGRVAFELEFKPLDLADTTLLAEQLLNDGITAHPELLAKLHAACEGSTRLVCVGLQRIESLAIKKGLKKVTVNDWGDRPLHMMEVGNRATRIATNDLRA